VGPHVVLQENDAFIEQPALFVLDRPLKLIQRFTINFLDIIVVPGAMDSDNKIPLWSQNTVATVFCSTVFEFLGIGGGMCVHPLCGLLFGLCIHELYRSLVTSHDSVKKFVPLFPVALKKCQGFPHSLSFVEVTCFGTHRAQNLCQHNLSAAVRYKVVLAVCGNSPEDSEIVKRHFPRMHCLTF
jgi:hypothetical protein